MNVRKTAVPGARHGREVAQRSSVVATETPRQLWDAQPVDGGRRGRHRVPE